MALLKIVVLSEGVMSGRTKEPTAFVFLKGDGRYADAGVPTIRSIAGLVNSLKTICSSRGTGTVISRLLIVAHANRSCVGIGDDILELSTFRQFQTKLGELKPLFDPKISSVVFLACELGQNPALIRCLSTVWGGVPVQAFTKDQGPYEPLGTGPTVVCQMSSCKM
jgi:hypothetical protein